MLDQDFGDSLQHGSSVLFAHELGRDFRSQQRHPRVDMSFQLRLFLFGDVS